MSDSIGQAGVILVHDYNHDDFIRDITQSMQKAQEGYTTLETITEQNPCFDLKEDMQYLDERIKDTSVVANDAAKRCQEGTAKFEKLILN